VVHHAPFGGDLWLQDIEGCASGLIHNHITTQINGALRSYEEPMLFFQVCDVTMVAIIDKPI
jgi:hypothetical protein